MKKILVRIPAAKSDWLAQFIGENQFVNLLSWAVRETSGLFNEETNIYAHIAYPEGSDDKIAANLQQYFVKKTS